MANNIVIYYFSRLDHLCLLPLPTEIHIRWNKYSLYYLRIRTETTLPGTQQPQPSGTVEFLGECETVIDTIFVYFYRKILEIHRSMEFNSWLKVVYIQLFGSITDSGSLNLLVRKHRITLSSLKVHWDRKKVTWG